MTGAAELLRLFVRAIADADPKVIEARRRQDECDAIARQNGYAADVARRRAIRP